MLNKIKAFFKKLFWWIIFILVAVILLAMIIFGVLNKMGFRFVIHL